MTMRAPLWWIWLGTFANLLWRGNKYLGVRRRDWREAARIAGIVAQTCGEIRGNW